MKCKQCPEENPARFGILVKSGQRDLLCIRCRFDAIDTKYSDPESIRQEMIREDIPVNRRAEKLK